MPCHEIPAYGVVIYIVTVIGIFAVCTLARVARVVKLATKDCFDSDINVVYPLKLNLS